MDDDTFQLGLALELNGHKDSLAAGTTLPIYHLLLVNLLTHVRYQIQPITVPQLTISGEITGGDYNFENLPKNML